MNKYQSGGASEAALIRRLSNEGQNELIKRIKLKMNLIYKEYLHIRWNTSRKDFNKNEIIQYLNDILLMTNDAEGKTTFKHNDRIYDLPEFISGKMIYKENKGMLLTDFFNKIEQSINDLEIDNSKIPFFLMGGYMLRATSKKKKYKKKSLKKKSKKKSKKRKYSNKKNN